MQEARALFKSDSSVGDKSYILYKHTSPNGKVYIGITCQCVSRRWGVGGIGYRSHPHFWNAIQKYGWDNFKHDILLCGLSKDEACKKEKEYIAKYRSNEPEYGYNLTSGGDLGYTFTPEVKEKQRSGMKAKWQESDYLEKMEIASEAKRGKRWKHSEETKAKMRKPKSEETKSKMRKPKSTETRRKMSVAKRSYFANMTPEQKEEFGRRVSESMKRLKTGLL